MRTSVVTLHSRHVGWAGLAAILDDLPNFQVVDWTDDLSHALRSAASLQPRIILLAADLEDPPAPDAALILRNRSLQSKLLVFGDLQSPRVHVRLALAGVCAFLTWDSITASSLPTVLSTVLEGGILVSSHGVRDRLLTFWMPSPTQLSPRELEVLRGMADGLTQSGVAHRGNLSVRTVRRVIATLEERFEAPSAFVLGLRTARLLDDAAER